MVSSFPCLEAKVPMVHCIGVMRQGKLLAMNNPGIGHGETSEPGSGSENNCQSSPLRPLPPENKHWRPRPHRGGTDLLAQCLHSLSMTSERSGSWNSFSRRVSDYCLDSSREKNVWGKSRFTSRRLTRSLQIFSA